MNPIIIKIVSSAAELLISSLINATADNQKAPLKTDKSSNESFSSLLKSLKADQEKAFHKPGGLSAAEIPSNKKGYHLYLESFKKALLENGKPLEKLSINREDLPLFKKFLFQCGFSPEKVGHILKDLLEKNPRGKINLSQFFLKINELGLQEEKNRKSVSLEPSIVPHIELALRKFGMAPKELSHVFKIARTEDGKFDLNRMIIKLKEIVSQPGKENQITIDGSLLKKISNGLEESGVHTTDKKIGGQITMKDFVKSLEQMTGRPDTENRLPAEVKRTIGEMLGKVALPEDEYKPVTSLTFYSNLKSKSPLSKEMISKESEPGENRVLMSPLSETEKPVSTDLLSFPLNDKGESVENARLLFPLKDKGTSAGNEQLLFPSKEERDPAGREKLLFALNDKAKPMEDEMLRASFHKKDRLDTENSPKNPETAHQGKSGGTLSNLEDGRWLNVKTNGDGSGAKSVTKTIQSFHNMTGSHFSETVHTVQQNNKLSQDFLPAYLVDQVGKQISRAALRGDRVLRLQLKPPELGAVKIEMDIRENGLKLAILTENSSVKELLLSNVHELREALMEQNVKLEEIDIQINYDFDPSTANSQEWRKEGQRWRHEPGGERMITEDHKEDPNIVSQNIGTDNHLLNLVA